MKEEPTDPSSCVTSNTATSVVAQGASTGCVDCGEPKTVGRGRCKPCWRKHVRALKESGEYQPRLSHQPLEDRLWGQVAAGPQGCVIWTGSVDRKTGYGKIRANERHTSPHRTAYELTVGPIPTGMQIDHACHTRDKACRGGKSCLHRRCLNPAHLEIVTAQENTRRTLNSPAGLNAHRTECSQGHPYDEENTVLRSDGHRGCRQCIRDGNRRRAREAPREPTKETCKNGHPLTEDNLYRRGSINACRTCINEARRRYKERKAAS